MGTRALLGEQQVIPSSVADELQMGQIKDKSIEALELFDLLLEESQ